MRIKCILNSGRDLPEDCLDPAGGFNRDTKFALVIGKEYNVYAITLFLGYVWYFICDEDYVYYPIWNPSPLFEVVDGRLSKYWRYNFIKGNLPVAKSRSIFAFEEWAKNPYRYYDNLTNGNESEVAIFKRYKDLMDLEFPCPSITKKASILKESWVMCPNCDESWEELSKDGMLRCPKCKEFLQNPFFNCIEQGKCGR
jgi:hypothetical protein